MNFNIGKANTDVFFGFFCPSEIHYNEENPEFEC